MGAYLSEPITEKKSTEGENEEFSFGASSMQGWRISQEVILLVCTNAFLFVLSCVCFFGKCDVFVLTCGVRYNDALSIRGFDVPRIFSADIFFLFISYTIYIAGSCLINVHINLLCFFFRCRMHTMQF